MLGLEDVIRRHPLTAVGLGAVAVMALIPRSKRGPWATGARAVAELCVEAEGEAEGEIVEQLAQTAIENIVKAMAHPEPEARHAAVHAILHRYKRRAHRRSGRFARDGEGRQRRYARQISALEAKIEARQAKAPDEQRQRFDHVLSALKAPPPSVLPPGETGRRPAPTPTPRPA